MSVAAKLAEVGQRVSCKRPRNTKEKDKKRYTTKRPRELAHGASMENQKPKRGYRRRTGQDSLTENRHNGKVLGQRVCWFARKAPTLLQKPRPDRGQSIEVEGSPVIRAAGRGDGDGGSHSFGWRLSVSSRPPPVVGQSAIVSLPPALRRRRRRFAFRGSEVSRWKFCLQLAWATQHRSGGLQRLPWPALPYVASHLTLPIPTSSRCNRTHTAYLHPKSKVQTAMEDCTTHLPCPADHSILIYLFPPLVASA